MSALGQKRTSEHVQSMSALPPKADIGETAFGVARGILTILQFSSYLCALRIARSQHDV